MISAARIEGSLIAVLFIDVDDFKRINDCFGHKQGDFLLQQVANRLSNSMRLHRLQHQDSFLLQGSDTLFRLSGDEFVMVCTGLDNVEQIDAIASRSLSAFAAPFDLKQHEVFAGISMGVAVYPHDGVSAESLLKYSDLAMYSAKAKGKNNFCFFSEDMAEKLQMRFSLEQDIRRGLVQQEFKVLYQPKYSLTNNHIMGFEALIRWYHPTKGVIYPEDFITVAEESDLICELGEYV